MSRPIITADNLSKAYRIGLKRDRMATLTGAAIQMLKSPIENFRRLRQLNTYAGNNDSPDLYWALKDVSFEISEGEVVGIIGRNGAGKSTLLKLLSRITDPTSGRAVLRGRVSSLLEVGTGFHPELTGRENVYLNGTILGMTKREVDRKFDEIVEFSGVERFLDTPIKRYSSGMTVRLAFAVAAHLEPEILIIDEVLAVGDAEFQKKCLGKMKDVAQGGRTVLFVSHQISAITSLCTRCVLLRNGRVHADGATEDIIPHYLSGGRESSGRNLLERPSGDAKAWFESLSFRNASGELASDFDVRSSITIELETEVKEPSPGLEVSVRFMNSYGIAVFTTERSSSVDGPMTEGRFHHSFTIPKHFLAPGRYTAHIACHRPGVEVYHMVDDAGTFVVHEAGSAMARYAGQQTGVILFNEAWTEVETGKVASVLC